jgi:hypothetical protein
MDFENIKMLLDKDLNNILDKKKDYRTPIVGFKD